MTTTNSNTIVANAKKELSWIKGSNDEFRALVLPTTKGLTWADVYNEDMRPGSFDKCRPYETSTELPLQDLDNSLNSKYLKDWIRLKVSVPMSKHLLDIVDLENARRFISCFGTKQSCRLECPFKELCKEETSKRKAQERAGTDGDMALVRNNIVDKESGISKTKAYSKVDQDTINKWKSSNREQYFRYLKSEVLGHTEKVALDMAVSYEKRVRKAIGKPFYVVLGRSGDVTKHKNWRYFIKAAEVVVEKEGSVEQYLDALFFYSKSREGFPPIRSIGSTNSGKKYDSYIKDYIKKLGNKVQKVYDAGNDFFKREHQLATMWASLNLSKLFPSKDFWLFHGKNTGLGKLPQFTEVYLRKRYPGELYNQVEKRYTSLLESIASDLRPIYLSDMNAPYLYVDVYDR